MKNVWVGYACSYDGGMGVEKTIEKVFGDEIAALLWAEDRLYAQNNNPDYYWREYKLFNVE
jgi:hypothetical protein